MPDPTTAYTLEECVDLLQGRDDRCRASYLEASILHHLRAAQAAASREAEIRAEAWEEGWNAGRDDGNAEADYCASDFGERPERAVNPYRSKP